MERSEQCSRLSILLLSCFGGKVRLCIPASLADRRVLLSRPQRLTGKTSCRRPGTLVTPSALTTSPHRWRSRYTPRYPAHPFGNDCYVIVRAEICLAPFESVQRILFILGCTAGPKPAPFVVMLPPALPYLCPRSHLFNSSL